MMSWQDQLKGDSITWLLECPSPDVRYRALRDLLDVPAGDPRLTAAFLAAPGDGPIATLLEAMQPEGYWEKPGPGYGPKYRSTVWSIITLAQLGASIEMDPRIRTACTYLLEHAFAPGGQVTYNGAPSGTFDCLQGNLIWSLMVMGMRDARLEQAYEWMARTVTGEGLAPNSERDAPLRYYAYQCGPLFACGANYGASCGWGAGKVMLAFSALPAEQRTPLIERAIQAGLDFLFSIDLPSAAYPVGDGKPPSGNWWKFGFPVFYITDLLQIAGAMVGLGYGHDPRLAGLLDYIRQKQDSDGRWPLEYHYHGKIWGEFGRKGQPNAWVTLRALNVLKQAGEA
jgi:hypothetical protein